MPNVFEDPPRMGKGFTKKMVRLFGMALYEYLRHHRLVAVTNGGFITDALGGAGKVLNLPDTFGSGGGRKIPLGLATSGKEIRVYAGAVDSIYPAGMSFGDVPPYVLKTKGDAGVVYLVISVDVGGGGGGAADQGDTGSQPSVSDSGQSGDTGDSGAGLTSGGLVTGGLNTGGLSSGSLQGSAGLNIGIIQSSGGLNTGGLSSGSL